MSCTIYFGLWIFEGFPFYLIAIGLFTNLIEFMLLKTFPFIEITSPLFVLTISEYIFVQSCFIFLVMYWSRDFQPVGHRAQNQNKSNMYNEVIMIEKSEINFKRGPFLMFLGRKLRNCRQIQSEAFCGDHQIFATAIKFS